MHQIIHVWGSLSKSIAFGRKEWDSHPQIFFSVTNQGEFVLQLYIQE